jgi:ribosomal protein S18 acetylase RimI-like enzyme
MGEPISIVPTTRAHLPVLAGVLSRAFVHDPMLLWPMADAPDMGARVGQVFTAIYTEFMDKGTMWEAGDGAGFAHWVPPGSAAGVLEGTDRIMALLRPLTDDDGARYEVMWDWVEARVPEDVWYLDMLAVEPARQGEGIGTALIRFGLNRAAADGADAYLETGVESNVAYYERFGFRVVEEGVPVEGGPNIWFMRTG